NQAVEQQVSSESISFVTRDVAADIAEVARSKNVDLVLMGFHKPVIGATILGGKVHQVLSQCQSDVAIFVDRDFDGPGKILVPFLGGANDRLAMELAS